MNIVEPIFRIANVLYHQFPQVFRYEFSMHGIRQQQRFHGNPLSWLVIVGFAFNSLAFVFECDEFFLLFLLININIINVLIFVVVIAVRM